MGLVNRLVDDGGALGAALDLAREIGRNGPLALAATKRILVESADWDAQQAWVEQEAVAGPVSASKDAVEGATAFAEKRDPVWRGE